MVPWPQAVEYPSRCQNSTPRSAHRRRPVPRGSSRTCPRGHAARGTAAGGRGRSGRPLAGRPVPSRGARRPLHPTIARRTPSDHDPEGLTTGVPVRSSEPWRSAGRTVVFHPVARRPTVLPAPTPLPGPLGGLRCRLSAPGGCRSSCHHGGLVRFGAPLEHRGQSDAGLVRVDWPPGVEDGGSGVVEVLRTADERFSGLPDWGYEPDVRARRGRRDLDAGRSGRAGAAGRAPGRAAARGADVGVPVAPRRAAARGGWPSGSSSRTTRGSGAPTSRPGGSGTATRGSTTRSPSTSTLALGRRALHARRARLGRTARSGLGLAQPGPGGHGWS